jgi:hypothetical protein
VLSAAVLSASMANRCLLLKLRIHRQANHLPPLAFPKSFLEQCNTVSNNNSNSNSSNSSNRDHSVVQLQSFPPLLQRALPYLAVQDPSHHQLIPSQPPPPRRPPNQCLLLYHSRKRWFRQKLQHRRLGRKRINLPHSPARATASSD